MADRPVLTTAAGAPIGDNQNSVTAGPRGPLLMQARFSTVAGELGATDAERDVRGFALKFYPEEGNWDLTGDASQASR